MPEESQALVRFEPGWVEDGVSEDGLPRYREIVRIIKSVPPYTQVDYVATEQDFDENPGPYQAFQREQGARLLKPADDGFPLALWPVISPAQFKALAVRDVSTIQQLAKLGGRPDLPGASRRPQCDRSSRSRSPRDRARRTGERAPRRSGRAPGCPGGSRPRRRSARLGWRRTPPAGSRRPPRGRARRGRSQRPRSQGSEAESRGRSTRPPDFTSPHEVR